MYFLLKGIHGYVGTNTLRIESHIHCYSVHGYRSVDLDNRRHYINNGVTHNHVIGPILQLAACGKATVYLEVFMGSIYVMHGIGSGNSVDNHLPFHMHEFASLNLRL